MAINIIKKTKTILTNPISSKTIYPFVIDRKVTERLVDPTDQYMDLGRLYKDIKPSSYLEGNLIFQFATLSQSKLFVKYDISLNGSNVDPIIETFQVEKNFLGNITKKFIFSDTKDNYQMTIAASAINESAVISFLPNKVNLVYLEIKEE